MCWNYSHEFSTPPDINHGFVIVVRLHRTTKNRTTAAFELDVSLTRLTSSCLQISRAVGPVWAVKMSFLWQSFEFKQLATLGNWVCECCLASTLLLQRKRDMQRETDRETDRVHVCVHSWSCGLWPHHLLTDQNTRWYQEICTVVMSMASVHNTRHRHDDDTNFLIPPRTSSSTEDDLSKFCSQLDPPRGRLVWFAKEQKWQKALKQEDGDPHDTNERKHTRFVSGKKDTRISLFRCHSCCKKYFPCCLSQKPKRCGDERDTRVFAVFSARPGILYFSSEWTSWRWSKWSRYSRYSTEMLVFDELKFEFCFRDFQNFQSILDLPLCQVIKEKTVFVMATEGKNLGDVVKAFTKQECWSVQRWSSNDKNLLWSSCALFLKKMIPVFYHFPGMQPGAWLHWICLFQKTDTRTAQLYSEELLSLEWNGSKPTRNRSIFLQENRKRNTEDQQKSPREPRKSERKFSNYRFDKRSVPCRPKWKAVDQAFLPWHGSKQPTNW